MEGSSEKSRLGTARIVGLLFIAGTVAGILSVVATDPILGEDDYLGAIAANEGQFLLGALLVLAMGLVLALIPVVLYPVTRKYSERLAVGYVVFRSALEAGMYVILAAAWLFLVSLSREATATGAPDAAYFRATGGAVLGTSTSIVAVQEVVFSVGALMLYWVLYRSHLIPAWLSLWGLAGAGIYLAGGLFGLYGGQTELLLAPLGIQEMVMALWLIVKGFNPAPGRQRARTPAAVGTG